MKIQIIRVDSEPEELLAADTPSYHVLQGWVGGLIAPVYFDDDPMGYWHIGFVNDNGIAEGCQYNSVASQIFPRYQDGLLGNCVILEGVGPHGWHNAKTWEVVRIASKEECLQVSRGEISDTMEENGVQLIFSEIDENDND